MTPLRRRSARGFTLVETVISVALVVGVLGAAVALLDTSNDLAQSVNDERAAAIRVDKGLTSISEEFRKGSLATVLHLDGTTFSDGDTDVGFMMRRVVGWNGSTVQSAQVRYEVVTSSGFGTGELIRQEGTLQTVLARGITAFRVTRSGTSFTFQIDAASGQTDDRQRKASGSVRVVARNP